MSPSEENALVTGGTGQIGRNLIPLLVDSGFRVKALVRSGQNPWTTKKQVSVIKGDIGDADVINDGIRDCDYVFHLAAYQNQDDRDRKKFYETNVIGTETLLNACAKANIKKVVNVSSIVVFQNTAKIERDENWGLRRETNLDHYASSKLESLARCRKLFAAANGRIPLVTVFPTAVINLSDFQSSAPNQLSSIQKFIWENIGGGIPGGVVNLIGNGSRVMNYVLMDDLVKGLLLAARYGKSGEEYILGGENATVSDYLQTAAKREGKKVFPLRFPAFPFKALDLFDEFVNLPPIIGLIARNISYDRYFSSSKAEKELGYKPVGKL